MKKRLEIALTTVVVIGLAVAGVAAVLWWQGRQYRTQHGEASGSVIGTDVITVVDRVSIRRSEPDPSTGQDEDFKTRVTSIDLATGKQLASRVVDGTGTCVRATAHRVWCDLDGLELYDMRTLEGGSVAGEIERAKLGTVLHARQGGRDTIVATVEGARATFQLEDGRVANYDASTRTLTRDDGPFASDRRGPSLAVARDCAPPLGGRQSIGGSTTTFLAPTVIGLEPPVFLHHTSLEPNEDQLAISRLDASGAIRWTIAIGRAGCENLKLDGTRLVLALTGHEQRVMAIDLERGTTLWSFGF